MKLDQLVTGDTVWCRLVGREAALFSARPHHLVQKWVVKEVTEDTLIACLEGFQNDEELEIKFQSKEQYRQSNVYYPDYVLFTSKGKAWEYLPDDKDTMFMEKAWFQNVYKKECYSASRRKPRTKPKKHTVECV